LLITGFDILFFWVARMIMLGIEFMGDVPFRTVYIHGLVRDAERQKMSKTKGNVVDPLVVNEQYGTDAVRFALLRGAAPGTDIVFSDERMTSSRAFANKIWNAARFIFMQMEKLEVEQLELPRIEALAPTAKVALTSPDLVSQVQQTIFGSFALEDAWIFHRLSDVAAKMDHAQKTFRFHECADLLYGFFWDEFCDWYVELKKLRINQARDGQGADARVHLENLLLVFECALRLLHPVMPFLSEELWQRLVKRGAGIPESLCIAAYPQANPAALNEAAARQMALLQEMITATRALRADQKLDPKQRLEGELYAHDDSTAGLAASQQAALEALTNTTFTLAIAGEARAAGALRSTPEFDVVLKLSGAQADAMKQRLLKEIEQLTKVVENTRRQLGNEKFTAKAPAHVIEEMRTKLADYETQIERSRAALAEPGA
jgi:valyl-tRNA synthetase